MSQRELQKLLTEYFREREDTSISSDDGRVFKLVSRSDHASNELGARDGIAITFESIIRQYDANCEYVSANHPFVDIVRNDLERAIHGNVRISETHVAHNPSDPNGELNPQGMSVTNANPNSAATTRYLPTFTFWYQVSIDGDIPSRQLLPVTVTEAKTVDYGVSTKIHDNAIPLCDGKPEGATSETNVITLLPAVNAYVSRIIQEDAARIASELTDSFQSEERRLLADFKRQVSGERNQFVVKEAQALHEKRLEDLAKKLHSQIGISLESVLIIWWPELNYRWKFESRRHGAFELSVDTYNSLSDSHQRMQCPNCGNSSKFHLCQSDQHLACAGKCQCVCLECVTCRDQFCTEHGGLCEHCSAAVCHQDGKLCDYADKHGPKALFCAACILMSYEDRAICADCANACELCGRSFPSKNIANCRKCKKAICSSHGDSPDGLKCSECREVSCQIHGLVTAENVWACKDHVLESTCCKRVFGKSSLKNCSVDKSEKLCPTHHKTCASCNKPVCNDRSHCKPLAKHAANFVCLNCRSSCSCCPDDDEHSYLSSDLRKCDLCWNVLCDEHRTHCEICNSTVMCPLHTSSLPACESCGRKSCSIASCSHHSSVCSECSMAYCSHCCTTGTCTTCNVLLKEQFSGDADSLLQRVAQNASDKRIASILANRVGADRIDLTTARNETYKIWRFAFHPAWWQVWKSKVSIIVVTSHAGAIERIQFKD